MAPANYVTRPEMGNISVFKGDGQDVITTTSSTSASTGTLWFSNVLANELTLTRGAGARANDLIINIAGGTDQITVTDHFALTGGLRAHGLSEINFGGSFIWTRIAVDTNTQGGSPPNTPTEGNDSLRGTVNDDVIDAPWRDVGTGQATTT